ncbi:MAG TPA: hypothetical protein VKD69_23695 [Vicinamibacterales bacterium]|nr:hypothetical protein [Vicinamibacterales bacterium]
MRNDARPIGEDNPLESSHDPSGNDARESVTHDRQSHIVNKETAENARRHDDDVDPAMPSGDSTMNTKI